MQIDHHLKVQLENREIPLGEILREKGFVELSQLEECLEESQKQKLPLGIILLKKGYVNQAQLKIALQDQAAIKKIQKKKTAPKRRLGDILLAAGVLTEEQLSAALEFSIAHGLRIGDALVQLGIVTEDELAQSVGEQLMIPYIRLSKTPPDPLVLEKIPAKVCEKHQVIPVKQEGEESLFVAMVDPQNILVIDDLEKSTGMKVVPMIVSEKDFKNSFEAHFGESAQAGNLIEMMDENEDINVDEADFDEDAAPIKALMNKVVTKAVELGTSDIHIEPFEHELRIRFRIDGMMRKGTDSLPSKVAGPISSRIKVMAGLDISEVRNPQDGKFRMSLKGKIVDVRVSTCPVTWGEKIVMRILDQSGNRLRLNDLGIDKENMEALQYGLNSPNGIVLVTGPTGSGKTTTLYSSLVSLNKPSVNIQTAEDPVEYDLPGISQTPCISEIGMTFSKALKAFLRQDPDIILIGEIRDLETAQIALKAALTGHLVLSTLHTNSAVESIGRLLNMGIDRFLITSAIRVILAQRLMRKLCEKCKEPQRLSKREIRDAGFTERLLNFEAARSFNLANLKLFRPKGCKDCSNNGFRGRMAIHEVLKITEEISVAVNREAPVPELKRVARTEGMMSLRDCAMIRTMHGLSSMDEVDRLTVNEDKNAASDSDEEMIDEILIRSGTWKLSAKELVERTKSGKWVPGKPSKIGSFFLQDDALETEKELEKLQAQKQGGSTDSAQSGSSGGVSFNSSVFEEILQEIRGLGSAPSSTDISTNFLVEDAKNSLKRLASGTLDLQKSQKLAASLFTKLDFNLQMIRLWSNPCEPVLKKIPIETAILQDFYNKIPKIASSLSSRIGKKIDLKLIRFSKEIEEQKTPLAADWGLLKQALTLILENHLEALISGGSLKIRAKLIKSEGKSTFEIVFHDTAKSQSISSEQLLTPSFTTKPSRLGLGLNVAQKIVEAHGGKLTIQILDAKGCQTKLSFSLK